MRQVFTDIYTSQAWGGGSVSGPGSTLERTAKLRAELPLLLRELAIHRLLDAPCGDFNWMQAIDLNGIHYIGVDIVNALILDNRRKYGIPGREFLMRDVVSDSLPSADLILCRDCLIHFSFEDSFKALKNMARSRAAYLLTTTFPDHTANIDIETGGWRPLNLEAAPFCFPPPQRVIIEGLNPDYPNKSLGLWEFADLP